MTLTNSRRLVLKIGSALLMDDETNTLNQTWLESFIADVAALSKQNIQILIVSSGAIAFGKRILNITTKKLSVDQKQAISAVGQIQLMHTYQKLLHAQGLTAAQVLLTLADSEDRRRYLNVRNTLHQLLNMQTIPIINENDTIATSEIRYGDNDRLSARVAQMINADTLVLLSDIDGFYTDDPTKNPAAEFIPTVHELTPELFSMAGDSATEHGSGGMITKLQAAKIATESGCRLLICKGAPLHPLQHFMTHQKGTWFMPKTSPASAKKNWLRQHLKPDGDLIIDAGALAALKKGASLLPIGVTQVIGTFQKGATVRILTSDHCEIARGFSNYASHDIKMILQKPSDQIVTLLGYEGCHEIVHRDNLAMLD